MSLVCRIFRKGLLPGRGRTVCFYERPTKERLWQARGNSSEDLLLTGYRCQTCRNRQCTAAVQVAIRWFGQTGRLAHLVGQYRDEPRSLDGT
jgi:hypothetical protein